MDWVQKKMPRTFVLSILSGETGTRTQATVARRQISNLLRYHSGTSPTSVRALSLKRRQSYDKPLPKQQKCVSSNSIEN